MWHATSNHCSRQLQPPGVYRWVAYRTQPMCCRQTSQPVDLACCSSQMQCFSQWTLKTMSHHTLRLVTTILPWLLQWQADESSWKVYCSLVDMYQTRVQSWIKTLFSLQSYSIISRVALIVPWPNIGGSLRWHDVSNLMVWLPLVSKCMMCYISW